MIRLTITKIDAAAGPPALLAQAPLDQRMSRVPHAESAKGDLGAKDNGQGQRSGRDNKPHPHPSEEKLA
jgi:hypothetical protein